MLSLCIPLTCCTHADWCVFSRGSAAKVLTTNHDWILCLHSTFLNESEQAVALFDSFVAFAKQIIGGDQAELSAFRHG